MKTTLITTALILCALTLTANAQDTCKVKVRIANFNWDNSKEFRYDQLSANQIEWYNEEFKKKFPKICITTEHGVADYLIAWSSTSQTTKYTYTVPNTSTTQHSGTVYGPGGTGGYSGTSTTTTNETRQGERVISYTNAFVNKLSEEKVETEVDGKKVMVRKMEKIPLYVSKHRGQWRWSKDDKDALVDAFKFINKQVSDKP